MYDPFAPPPVPGQMQTTAVSAPSGVLSPNNALAPTQGPQRPGGPGFGGPMGRYMGGLQLPADMTAQDFLSQMQGLDWHSLKQGYHGDVRDWRQGGMTGDRPTMQNEFAQYFGGTYGAPSGVSPMPPSQLPVDPPMMTPGGGGIGAQGPNTHFPLNPGAPSPPSNDWRTMRAPKPSSYGI